MEVIVELQIGEDETGDFVLLVLFLYNIRQVFFLLTFQKQVLIIQIAALMPLDHRKAALFSSVVELFHEEEISSFSWQDFVQIDHLHHHLQRLMKQCHIHI